MTAEPTDLGFICETCGMSDDGRARLLSFWFPARPCLRCVDHFGPQSEPPPAGDECLLWSGPVDKDGYGDRGRHRTAIDGLSRKAHRAVYELAFGPIPDGMLVRHHCDTPACIKPRHLLLGTQADNIADAVERDRICRGEARPDAKLTDAQAVEIANRRAAGERGVDLAAEFGVAPTTVCDIYRRRRWVRTIELELGLVS